MVLLSGWDGRGQVWAIKDPKIKLSEYLQRETLQKLGK